MHSIQVSSIAVLVAVCAASLLSAPPARAEEPTQPEVATPPPLPPQSDLQPQPDAKPPEALSRAETPPPASQPSHPTPDAPHPDRGASVKDVDESNNPLATKVSANFQNYYVPSLSGLSDSSANTAFLRVSTPFWRILPRVSLPLQSLSTPGTSVSGLGDLQAFAAFLFTKPTSPIELGAGPLYIAPTATDPALGTGKHQGGASVILVYKTPGLVLGSLIQYQLSFAGDGARQDTESLTTQIFAIAQIGAGYYVRSSPTATFDVQNGNYNVPIGIGVGKVFMLDTVVTNVFLEPQYVILSQGLGQPVFQLFSGINTQFSL